MRPDTISVYLYPYPGYTYDWDKHTIITRETRLERKRETNCQVQVNDVISVFVIFWSETLPDYMLYKLTIYNELHQCLHLS